MEGQVTLEEYMKKRKEFVFAGCFGCCCRNCLYWWSQRCPYGECWDDHRAKVEPYDQAQDRGDGKAVERLEAKVKNYDTAIDIVYAAKMIEEGSDKMKEEEINSQCNRCSEKYREQEGCPKEKGCGGIILLACRIQSAEFDHRNEEGR